MSTTLFEQYTRDGFVVLKDIIPISRINQVFESIFVMYCKYSGNKDDFKSLDEPWNTNLFHQKLIEFRKNDVVVNPILLRREILLELEYNLILFRLGNKYSLAQPFSYF